MWVTVNVKHRGNIKYTEKCAAMCVLQVLKHSWLPQGQALPVSTRKFYYVATLYINSKQNLVGGEA